MLWAWGYEGLGAHCRLIDEEIVEVCRRCVEVWSSGVVEARRMYSNKEVWRYGGGLQACRRGGKEVSSTGALEVGCRCVASLPQEIWSSGGVLRAWGRLHQEIWSSGGMLRVWGRVGVRLKSSGVLQACCGPGGVEA